jgi:hypothetical protein
MTLADEKPTSARHTDASPTIDPQARSPQDDDQAAVTDAEIQRSDDGYSQRVLLYQFPYVSCDL